MVRPKTAASLVGKRLADRYELLEIIGDGGVGVVYRARLVSLERMVAVKVLHEYLVEEEGFVTRFRREALAMSRLYHPHCVAVIDSGLYQSRPYLVLEYLPGETLKALIEKAAFEPQRAVSIALQLLETLDYFHGHHVIHRDLKSENVMLVESSGTADFVKVLDFGMAKVLTGPGADSQISKMGIVPGTPSAMAPEQIYQLPPDPRIDIYATGILLYEMIVGRRPFSGTDMAKVVKMQISTPPQPPREVLGEDALSAELEQVIIKALEKDRIDRFGTAAEMAAALRLTPEGRATAAPPPGSELVQPPTTIPARGRRWLPRVAFAAVLALGGVAAAVQLEPASLELLPESAVKVWLKGQLAQPKAPAPIAPTAARASVVAAPAPVPAPVTVAAADTWLVQRNLAVSYASRGQHEEAFRAIEAAVADDPAAAGADGALAKAAVEVLTGERVTFVTGAFRGSPELIEALAEATAKGASSDLRHAAHDGLRTLGQLERADQVAMWILDVEQASTCGAMRAAFKQLRASDDPRVKELKSELRKRSRKDRHVRCLKRVLRR